MTTAQPDGIHYYVELLPGGHGQLRVEMVLDGQLDHGYRIGRPAPLATVLAAAELMNRYTDADAAERT